MDREPKMTGAVTALLIALPFALVLAWSQPTRGPSRAELAEALSREAGRTIAASDLRSIRCTVQSVTYECRWEQRADEAWSERSGRLATGGDGWRLAKDETR
ncbi:MAG: hypothetical protein J7494_11070 [Sphingobium sp.]|nr:hypothetical protein [Sphingobium sp.]